MEHLTDKVAVITGGASGIGPASDQAVAELSANGTTVKGVVCDVGDLKAVQRLADTAFDSMGAVRLVFHNAGVAVGGPIVNMKHSDWEWTLRVNLWTHTRR